MKSITFSEEEHEAYRQRLAEDKFIVTMRVSAEVGCYSVGEVRESCLGRLQVGGRLHLDNLDGCPYRRELTDKQRAEIENNVDEGGIDILWLVKSKL